MKWYTKVWKRIIKGILLFLFPLMIVLIILEKAFSVIQKLILPIKLHLPEEGVFGIGMVSLLSILLLLVITFLAGIWAEKKNIKSFIPLLEEKLLVLIPGYALMKSRANEAFGDSDQNWKSVIIGENEEWKFGIEIERNENGYSMIFFPDAPDAKSGELKMISSDKIRMIDMPINQLTAIIKKYGIGSTSLIYLNEK